MIYKYIMPILLFCPAAGAREMWQKRRGLLPGGVGRWAWGSSMSLLAIKSAYKPVVVGLAGMVQEWPATRLAGMDLAKICVNMERIYRYM